MYPNHLAVKGMPPFKEDTVNQTFYVLKLIDYLDSGQSNRRGIRFCFKADSLIPIYQTLHEFHSRQVGFHW